MVSSQRPSKSKTEAFKNQFNAAVSLLFAPTSREGTALLNHIQRTGRLLKIRNLDAKEVISEAVMRGLTLIENKGEGIENPHAWLSKVSTYILYDLVKDEKKNRELKAKNTRCVKPFSAMSQLETEEERKQLRKALERLSEEDQEILDLRFYQGKQFKEIKQYYLEEAGISVKVPTLRKRESRARQRLRDKFQELYK